MRKRKEFFKIIIVFTLVFFICETNAFSYKKNSSSLKKIKSEIQKKKKEKQKIASAKTKVKKDISKIQKEIISVAKNIKSYEKNLNKLDRKIYELKAEENDIKKTITGNKVNISQTIASLERIANVPVGVLLTKYERPTDTIRVAMLLNSTIEYLQIYTEKLRSDLEALKKIRSQISNKKTEISKITSTMNNRKKEVSRLLSKKKRTQRQLSDKEVRAQKTINKLVRESKTIAEFLKKARASKKDNKEASLLISRADKNSKFAKLKGKMPLPANGKIIVKYGAKKSSGIKSKGITIKTRKSAQVISPNDGVILFAGDFKGYGNTLIVYHGNNYYTVLSGLKQIFAGENQDILAGEPVGEMTSAKNNKLYVELRYKEKAINPLIYFR